MNPFKILWSLALDPKQKFLITMLLMGVKDVTRIDLFTGDTSPEAVKLALLKLKLHFANMRVSGKPGHMAGLVVSKSVELVEAVRLANEAEDVDRLIQLLGEQYVFPVKLDMLKDINFPNRASHLYRQMQEHELIVV